MTKKLEYFEIMNKLPQLNPNEEFMKEFKSEKEFKLWDEPNTLFVKPTFSINDDFINDTDPQVILISASGAVGKSTLAKEIAFEKHVPIFNLADCETVGKKSFSGIIADSFDDLYQEMIINFRHGKHFFIIDALDEGRMKTNEEGFSAFLADIAKHAKRTSGISFILLGRNQVIETVWVELNDSKVRTLTLNIDPFNEFHAVEYIDKKVNSEIGSSNLIEQHKNHYEEARNLIYYQLKHAVHLNDKDKESQDSKFFLGYAPVLDAISTLLSKERNFIKLKESFSGDNLATSRSVLIHIVEYILTREQEEKFLPNFMQKSEQVATRLDWNAWNVLYTNDEQARLLLSKDLDHNELGVPEEIVSIYEESIDIWLPEHPFMNGKGFANIVFESYILAKNLTSNFKNTYELAEDYIKNSGLRDFPLLADFYYYFITQREQYAKPEHMGIIYDSLTSFMPNQCFLELSIDGPDVEEIEEQVETYNDIECTLILFKKAEDSLTSLMEYDFKMVYHQNSKLVFKKGIRNSQINVPFDVELGYLGIQEYSFTANVFINCRKLFVNAKSIVVQKNVRLQEESDDEQQYVLLNSLDYEGLVEEKPKCFTKLVVNWDGSNRYPWSDYSKPVEQDTGIDKDIFRRFKRIALAFRSHSKGEMARFIDKIEHRRLLKGELGEKILQRMLDDGILIKRLSDNMYVWQSVKADELLGVSWTSLRNGSVPDKLRAYLNQFETVK